MKPVTIEPKPKRIKTVFGRADQVMHVWASQTQEYGRHAGRINRLYFKGTEAFSYGSHYKLGDLVQINGHTVALINTTGHSVTTGKHINRATRAVSHMPTIYVDHTFNWLTGLLTMQGDLVRNVFDLFAANKFRWAKSGKDVLPTERISRFNSVCDAVNKPDLKITIPQDLVDLLDAHVKARAKRNAELDKGQAERRAKRDAAETLKSKDQIDAWIAGTGPLTENIRRIHPQLIRVKGSTVETTRGATVPLPDALRLLMRVQNSTVEPGTRVGSFEFNSIHENTVKIACHTLDLLQAVSVLSKVNQA